MEFSAVSLHRSSVPRWAAIIAAPLGRQERALRKGASFVVVDVDCAGSENVFDELVSGALQADSERARQTVVRASKDRGEMEALNMVECVIFRLYVRHATTAR